MPRRTAWLSISSSIDSRRFDLGSRIITSENRLSLLNGGCKLVSLSSSVDGCSSKQQISPPPKSSSGGGSGRRLVQAYSTYLGGERSYDSRAPPGRSRLASFLRVSHRTRSSADDVIAGIDIFDIPGERGRAVADQERRKISDILDTHEPVLRGASASRSSSSSKHSIPDAARVLSCPGDSAWTRIRFGPSSAAM